MKKEQTTFTFATSDPNGYQAKEKEKKTFKPQNYTGGFFLPLWNAFKGLICVILYSVRYLSPFRQVNAPITLFQLLITILGTWIIFTMDLEDKGGFTREISKAGFMQLSDNKVEMTISNTSFNKTIELKEADVNALIVRFGKVAKAENRKFNIPASVLLAVAILESNAGKSDMVKTNNNFFGSRMKNKSYLTAWENWRAHSLSLYQRAKGHIERVDDREEWIYFIANGEEGNANLYAWQLKTLIAEYNLHHYDEIKNS